MRKSHGKGHKETTLVKCSTWNAWSKSFEAGSFEGFFNDGIFPVKKNDKIHVFNFQTHYQCFHGECSDIYPHKRIYKKEMWKAGTEASSSTKLSEKLITNTWFERVKLTFNYSYVLYGMWCIPEVGFKA